MSSGVEPLLRYLGNEIVSTTERSEEYCYVQYSHDMDSGSSVRLAKLIEWLHQTYIIIYDGPQDSKEYRGQDHQVRSYKVIRFA